MFYSDETSAKLTNYVVLHLIDECMRWTVAEVVSFLKSKDLAGPANVLFANGVRGEDFITMLVESFVHDLRLSEFTARRLAAARDIFLSGNLLPLVPNAGCSKTEQR